MQRFGTAFSARCGFQRRDRLIPWYDRRMAVRRGVVELNGRGLESGRPLPATLMRTAEVLEWSARLAEQHTEREGRRGRQDAAVKERDSARRTRVAAQRARAEAKRRAV